MTLLSEFLDMINDDFFGEDIIYNGSSIRAVVYRDGLSNIPERNDRGSESKILQYKYGIRIAKDATYGSVTAIPKTHTVQMYKNIGDSSMETFRVGSILHQDPATWKLGLTL